VRATGLSGAVALVTGAAGGIGGRVAARLAEEGAIVAAADLRAVEPGPSVRPYALDVTDEARVEAVVAAVEAELGPIAILVCAAGVLGSCARLLDQSADEWERVFAVNARGTFLCVRAAARRMAPRGRGVVVTVASNSASALKVGQGVYGASKAAAQYVTSCLGLELARDGIRCVVVNPGTTETAMVTSRWRGPDDRRRLVDGDGAYRAGVPLGRLAQPDDVAEAVVFLASDRAAHITCASITVDGGSSLRAG
jgi:2,3-dihydro-2,3-dihydroxybenzoate dehydrogenase